MTSHHKRNEGLQRHTVTIGGVAAPRHYEKNLIPADSKNRQFSKNWLSNSESVRTESNIE
jgi:hypothetical protein